MIEANSVGTPAVGYDVPGLRDSIRHGRTGLLANPGDSEALAQQAFRLVHDDAACADSLVANATATLVNFDSSKWLDDIERLYTSMADEVEIQAALVTAL